MGHSSGVCACEKLKSQGKDPEGIEGNDAGRNKAVWKPKGQDRQIVEENELLKGTAAPSL